MSVVDRAMTTAEQLEAHRKKVIAAYHAQFELIKETQGYRARHKVTGQSYQAHDIATGIKHGGVQ